MLSNNLNLTAKNFNSRLIVSDNDNTYFTVSNFSNPYDGLWSYGVNIFNGIIPDDINNKIMSKVLSPSCVQVNFSRRLNLNFYLFKNNKGLLVELNNKNLIRGLSKEYDVFINLKDNFEIIENNISDIILEYSGPHENTYGTNKIYAGIMTDIDFSIFATKQNNNSIHISLKTQIPSGKTPYIYIVYDTNYHNIKNQMNLSNAEILQSKTALVASSTKLIKETNFLTEDNNVNRTLNILIANSDVFLMKKNGFTGIYAGYPWFDNYWGRDTFISLPGLLIVQGKYKEAMEVVGNFSRYQSNNKDSADYGKIPNVIFNKEEALYNSADATCLYIREIYEYLLNTGDFDEMGNLWEHIELAINNVYLNHKEKNNLFRHESCETWMDAKLNDQYPFCRRGFFAVEIQVLWYTALSCAANIGKLLVKKMRKKNPDIKSTKRIEREIQKYKDEAVKLKASIQKFFIKDSYPFIIDSLDSGYNEIKQVRPNGLLSIYYSYLPGVPQIFEQKTVFQYFKSIMNELVYEQGVSSLSKKDKFFHPMHINGKYHKDASYHNGVIWNWLTGAFVHAACRLDRHDLAFNQTQFIIKNLIEDRTPGTIDEIADPYMFHPDNSTGAYSQAWSVGEFIRSFYQDYLGIRLNVPQRKLYIAPNIPAKLGTININFKFGLKETVSLNCRVNKKDKFVSYIEIKGIEILKPLYVFLKLGLDLKQKTKKILLLKFKIHKAKDIFRLTLDKDYKNGIKISNMAPSGECEIINAILKKRQLDYSALEKLDFTKAIGSGDLDEFETLRDSNYLEKDILNN